MHIGNIKKKIKRLSRFTLESYEREQRDNLDAHWKLMRDNKEIS